MDVRPYFVILWRWLWLFAVGIGAAALGAFLFARAQQPIFETSTLLRVNPGQSPVGPNYQDILMSERLIRTYSELLTTFPVLEATAIKMGQAENASLPITKIEVVPVRETQLIRLVVGAHTPEVAAEVANALPAVFLEANRFRQDERFREAEEGLQKQLTELEQNIYNAEAQIAQLRTSPSSDQTRISTLENQISLYRNNHTSVMTQFNQLQLTKASLSGELEVMEPAVVPTSPVSPRVVTNTLLGAVVGAILVGLVVLAIEFLDDTLKETDQLQRLTGLTLLGTLFRIPAARENEQGKLTTVLDAKSAPVEAYRALRTNLQFSALDRPLRRLLITSAGPREGKSLTASNLAIAIAQAGQRVILVDADLHRPVLHTLFGVANSRGLTSALLDEKGATGALLKTPVENLMLLPSGPLPPNPSELLGSARMRTLMEQLEGQADLVIFDSPPVLAVTDALVLSASTDGVLLVAKANQTRREAVQQTITALQHVGARLLGITLNQVGLPSGAYTEYYSSDGEGGGGTHQGRRRWTPANASGGLWASLTQRFSVIRRP